MTKRWDESLQLRFRRISAARLRWVMLNMITSRPAQALKSFPARRSFRPKSRAFPLCVGVGMRQLSRNLRQLRQERHLYSKDVLYSSEAPSGATYDRPPLAGLEFYAKMTVSINMPSLTGL